MKFGRAELLLLLWLVPAAIVFFAWAFRRKRQLLLRFAAAEVLGRLVPAQSPGRQRAKAALLVLALGGLGIALSEPRWGWRWEEMHRKGADVLVAIDVSKSMLAEDLKPSRLERAKREVIDLLRVVEGDRIGLVAFAGAAFVQCPLTLDYGAAQIFLDALSPDLIPVPGTALAEAIRTATQAFGPGTHDARALVLITDGEDLEEGAIEAAKEAKKEGIKIFAVGMGAPDGAPIPDPAGGFRKDESGNVILSRLDETTLQKIALETGGTYVRAGASGLDLEQLYWKDIKGRTSARELESPRQRRWEERFQWFVGLALLALVIEALLPERRRQARGRGAAVLLLVALVGAGGPAHAESTAKKVARASARAAEGKLDEALKVLLDAQVDDPGNPAIQYNVGVVQERLGHHDEARKALEAVLSGPDASLRARAAYNLGNVAYAEGKLDEAIERFKRALELDPNDADAKKNLEIVRDELKRRIEENKKRQQEQQQQQKQDQQKQDPQKQDPQKQDPQGQKDQQQQQQQQGKDSQKQDPQKQDQQGQPQGGGQDKQKPGEQKPEQQPGGGKDGKKDEQKDQQAGQAQAARAGKMSKEDAERLLRGVREDPTKFQKRRVRAPGGSRGGRDW